MYRYMTPVGIQTEVFQLLTQPDLSLAAVALEVVEVETFLMLDLAVLLLERFVPLTTKTQLESRSIQVSMHDHVREV